MRKPAHTRENEALDWTTERLGDEEKEGRHEKRTINEEIVYTEKFETR